MKRLLMILVVALVGMWCMSTTDCVVKENTPTRSDMAQQQEMQQQARATVPIPDVSYFQEKRTIAKWAERWDKPSIPCFVYLISFGRIIGYYVTDGKPASTRSYLFPEQNIQHDVDLGEGWGDMLVQAPDIDGTYGENNPGIRFFTAEGTAVEWAGEGASYIYSDTPLPIDVPRLNVKAKVE